LAKVKNFKDEKEIIAIVKTPGHRKNRKVIESLPLGSQTKIVHISITNDKISWILSWECLWTWVCTMHTLCS